MDPIPEKIAKNASDPEREPYESPELVELGELRELVGYAVSVFVP